MSVRVDVWIHACPVVQFARAVIYVWQVDGLPPCVLLGDTGWGVPCCFTVTL